MLVEGKIDSCNQEQIANDRRFYKALREMKHAETREEVTERK